MKILFLQPQPCIRALKYAKGLKWALGDKVNIVFGYLYHTLTELYGYGDEFFVKRMKLDRGNLERSVRDLVRKCKPKLIHSHNAPDLLTVSAIKAVDDIPIIHDNHEVLSIRKTRYYVHDDDKKILEYLEHEKIANEQSDGRIYVSEGVRDYIQSRYKVDANKDLVFYSYVSKSVVPRSFKERLSKRDGQTHIVYIGTVTSRIQGSHYDLREIFKGIANRKMHIHIYVSRFGLKDKAYKEMAETSRFIHYHGNMGQRTLLQEITQYDFGWAGFNRAKNEEHLDVALPNKIMEYIACGLPVLAFPHKTLRSFIKKYKVGLVFNDLDELSQQLRSESEKINDVRKNVLKARYKFTIKRNIGRVLDFYKDIMHAQNQRV